MTSLNAQKTELTTGDWQISAGAGLVPTYVADGGKIIVPPVTARIEYQIAPKISLGAFAAYSKSESQQIDRLNGTSNIYLSEFYMVGLRAAANTNRFKNWNIYGGMSLGYTMPQVETQTFFTDPENNRDDEPFDQFSQPATNQMIFSGFIGATRYFGEKIGAYAEIGYGVSLLNAGITIRL